MVLWCYANNVCECEISPDKRWGGRKDERRGGGTAHRSTRRGASVVKKKIKIVQPRETLVGVDTEARASCSGEHVVPCLPSCSSVSV